MTSQYDKLGSLLNEALKEEKIPQFNQKNTNNEQKSIQSVNKIIHLLDIFNINHDNFSTILLKQQYHALLKKYHPDSNKEYISKQNISSIKINKIKNAYEKILKWYNSEGYKYFD